MKPCILKDCEGRQDKEGKKMTPKTKGNKESKNYCKNFEITETIFFFHGGGTIIIGIDVKRYMFLCVPSMQ